MTTLTTPAAGDLFRLDGHDFHLTDPETRYASDGTPVVIQTFERPQAPDEATAAAWRANPAYPKSGKCRQDELVWYTRADWLDAARSQALAIKRARPYFTVYVDAALAALEAKYADHQAGCWGLPDRHLLPIPKDAHLLRPDEAAAQAAALAGTEG